MPFKAVAIGIGAGISVLAVTGVLFLDRAGGTDDSGEPRFLRFVANQPSLDLNRFVRAEVGARARKLGYRLTVERVTLENTGKYLEEEGLSGIASDVTALIKRNPIPALFIGIGVGFLLARACTSRS